ncbi:MAG: hypothetical protein KME50_27205, partial [Nostoc desertorum CM1-VF14]|nr:hypothetical protein [Nostoc desertorum CM1-VF14]
MLNQKNTKSKKQTKAQLQTNSLAKAKKATKKNSAKKIESEVTRQSLNQEQKIAPNSATVVPTPETLTPVAQSNLPNHLTAQTQLNLDSTSTETSVQDASILPTVTNSYVSDESKLTRTPDVSTTPPQSLGEQPTLTRQSLNQEQKTAPNSATVVPIPETLTPVAQSNLPNHLTAQTQLNLDSTSTETSVQNAAVPPTVTNSYVSDQSKPARTPDVSTTAPPSLGEQPTLTRQSLNQEQKTAPNSPTVVPTSETLTPVAQSNLPNHLTAQTQLNLDSTSTETSVQNASIPPTVTNSYVSDESKLTRTPDVSTTAPPSLGEQPTLTRQSFNQEQKIAPNSATVV